jgi:hypothetical protein
LPHQLNSDCAGDYNEGTPTTKRQFRDPRTFPDMRDAASLDLPPLIGDRRSATGDISSAMRGLLGHMPAY